MKITDEIRARVYRELADDIDDHSLLSAENLRNRAKEKDPPRPGPGTLVWWRHKRVTMDWKIGESDHGGVWGIRSQAVAIWNDIEWKPARILGPDGAVVKIPPVSAWPKQSNKIVLWPRYYTASGEFVLSLSERVITRAEAEAMESEQ